MKVANRKLYSNNHSGYRCIHWDKRNHRWVVKVSYNSKRLYLGGFKNIEDAARARGNYEAASLIFYDTGVTEICIKHRKMNKIILYGIIPKNGFLLAISLEPDSVEGCL